jgi:hypothetical protein
MTVVMEIGGPRDSETVSWLRESENERCWRGARTPASLLGPTAGGEGEGDGVRRWGAEGSDLRGGPRLVE